MINRRHPDINILPPPINNWITVCPYERCPISWARIPSIISSEIYVFTYEESWKNIQKISALPESFVGENLAADILVSKDGKYLYASNRGCNNVSVFKIEQDTGLLHFCKSVSTKGWTRAIELSEKEEIFFALNEEYADSIGELEAFSMNGGMPEQAVSNRRCIFAYSFCAM